LQDSCLSHSLSQSSKGRRPGADDIDASSRLLLLNDVYYRDILGEFGAFFALANRIDRVHKNSWIGFQSWRATAKKVIIKTYLHVDITYHTHFISVRDRWNNKYILCLESYPCYLM
jgi:hypothetical protein